MTTERRSSSLRIRTFLLSLGCLELLLMVMGWVNPVSRQSILRMSGMFRPGVTRTNCCLIHDGMNIQEAETVLGMHGAPFGKWPGQCCGAGQYRFDGPEGTIIYRAIFEKVEGRASFYERDSDEWRRLLEQ